MRSFSRSSVRITVNNRATASRRAAAEMMRRVDTLLHHPGQSRSGSSQIWGGTFHAIAARLLRRFGKSIGLDKAWAYNVVKALGNYGEIYDRNIGPNTPLQLQRGVNAQWNQGGIQYGIPIL